MRLFEGMVGSDSVADFWQFYFSYWSCFYKIQVALVDMVQGYYLWLLLVCVFGRSQYHVIFYWIMHWLQKHVSELLVFDRHLVLGLIQTIFCAKPRPVFELSLRNRPAQNRLISVIDFSFRLYYRWQAIALAPHWSIVA